MAPNPVRYDNRIFTFIANGARQVKPQRLDGTEDIEFEFLPLATVLSLIDSGGVFRGAACERFVSCLTQAGPHLESSVVVSGQIVVAVGWG